MAGSADEPWTGAEGSRAISADESRLSEWRQDPGFVPVWGARDDDDDDDDDDDYDEFFDDEEDEDLDDLDDEDDEFDDFDDEDDDEDL